MLDKVITLTLCASIAFALNPRDICNENGSDGFVLPHENCNQFYSCVGGEPVAQSCPLDLLFNSMHQYCDWPENVDCNNRDIAEAVPSTTTQPEQNGNDENEVAVSTCATEGSDGLLVPHENCNQFYKCSEGKPVAFLCPLNLLYNPLNEQCDWPENVDCSIRDIPEAGPETPSQPEDIPSNPSAPNTDNDENEIAVATCAIEGSDGLLVPHENCNQFYKCSEGKPVALSCPLNLLYNPLNEQCDWPENVDCSIRDILETVPDTPSQPEDIPSNPSAPNTDNNKNEVAVSTCATEGSDGILLPHENCNQFYKCSEGKPVALSCPLNLLYNLLNEQCDWPENVDCSIRDILEVVPDTPSQPEDIPSNPSAPNTDNNENEVAVATCATEGSDGLLLPHEHCNQFYKCSEGKPVAFSCPSNLLYNLQNEQCDWPENVDCSIRNNPETVSKTSKGAATICAAEGSDGKLLPHENCNQFYMCSEGVPVALFCQLNLLYNMEQQYCDWPENVNCGERNIPGAESSPTEAPISSTTAPSSSTANLPDGDAATICAAEGSDGILLPHENCNQFYKCSEGAPAALSCQLNLLYNIKKQYCDWPENVNCGERNIPGAESSPTEAPISSTIAPSSSTANLPDGDAATICAAEGSDGILLPHENCNQFYKCSEGAPAALSCQLNLLYNIKKQYCDWPENVDCGDRNVPSAESSRT